MPSKHGHRKISLPVIPEPKPNTRAVLVPAPGVIPVIKGAGDLDLLCGKCKTTLIEGIYEGQIQNIVIRCPNCKSHNDIFFSVERWNPKFPKSKTGNEK
jgi:phage FluMu protein Com